MASGSERFYVSDEAEPGGDGSSWDTALTSLQDALAKTIDGRGDEVWVEAGTYYPDQGSGLTQGDRLLSFKLGEGVTLLGGFAGTETDAFQRDWEVNPTILSGAIHEDETYWSVHVVDFRGGATIDGFTIKNGNANGFEGDHGRGGGLWASSFEATITAKNCTILDNTAVRGSGVFGYEVSLSNCILSGNVCSENGAAIYANYLDATTCQFFDNGSVDSNSIICGNTFNLLDCEFEENLAKGPTIYSWDSDGNISANRCSFTQNTTAGNGGVMHGSVELENCIFSENQALHGAALYINNDNNETSKVINCIFNSNSSTGEGGAIRSTGRTWIWGSLFVGNSAMSGGALHLDKEHSIVNSTFVQNTASTTGGAIYTSGNISLTNSILWRNSENGSSNAIAGSDAMPKVQDYSFNSVPIPDPVHAANLLEGGLDSLNSVTIDFEGSLVNESDPFFDSSNPLGPDGLWNTADDGLQLKQSASSIDSGLSELWDQSYELSLGGRLRIQDDAIDLGAYEFGELVEESFRLTMSANNPLYGYAKDYGDGIYRSGENATVEAYPALGYSFTGWVGSISSQENPITFSMDDDHFLTATFAKDTSDLDGDGLTNFEELAIYGTRIDSVDSDGDGLPDGKEAGTIFDPAVNDLNTIQLLKENPQLYLSLLNGDATTLGSLNLKTIRKTEGNSFVLMLNVLESSDLKAWNEAMPVRTIQDGASIQIEIPAQNDASFFQLSTSD
ncbi:hypothetical protein [Pelagicoccus sp. SDUM812003]|uniref:InlB B-repeat-containing protein n=1 Tax=Pelagicoccus sp. SDUM812003 TaxID=3041267 RepID=UPI00280DD2C8|nr:hypothetical protein [Pelagicoccus sp. SDUM812003]MDQ8203350.1 hypothetical protein [Pelagicoccus sp. SDUM812003]